MYVRRPWWLHWSVQVLVCLLIPAGAVYAVARRLQSPTSRKAPAHRVPTMQELAEADRLVTVVPPKTRKTLVAERRTVFTLTPHEPVPGSPTETLVAVKGLDAVKSAGALTRAARQGFEVASAGWDDRDPNVMTRDELDAWFKATNRAIFLATGRRPALFFAGASRPGPSQQVVDYAAINGMVTCTQG